MFCLGECWRSRLSLKVSMLKKAKSNPAPTHTENWDGSYYTLSIPQVSAELTLSCAIFFLKSIKPALYRDMCSPVHPVQCTTHCDYCLPALRHQTKHRVFVKSVHVNNTILCFVWIQMCSSSIPRSCSVEKENISSFKTRLYQVSPFHTENLQCGQGRYKLFTKMAVSGFTFQCFANFFKWPK